MCLCVLVVGWHHHSSNVLCAWLFVHTFHPVFLKLGPLSQAQLSWNLVIDILTIPFSKTELKWKPKYFNLYSFWSWPILGRFVGSKSKWKERKCTRINKLCFPNYMNPVLIYKLVSTFSSTFYDWNWVDYHVNQNRLKKLFLFCLITPQALTNTLNGRFYK